MLRWCPDVQQQHNDIRDSIHEHDVSAGDDKECSAAGASVPWQRACAPFSAAAALGCLPMRRAPSITLIEDTGASSVNVTVYPPPTGTWTTVKLG